MCYIATNKIIIRGIYKLVNDVEQVRQWGINKYLDTQKVVMKLAQLFEKGPFPQNTRTLTTDVTFVLRTIYDNYDLLTSTKNVVDLVVALNQLFADKRIEFRVDDSLVDKYEEDQAIDLGIIEAELQVSQKIVVFVTSFLYDSFQEETTLKQVVFYMASFIRHEMVHREQATRSTKLFRRRSHATNRLKKLTTIMSMEPYKNRNLKSLTDYQQYIAEPHELYAMAHEVIQQLQNQHVSKAEILNALRQRRSPILMKSARFISIFSEFAAKDKFKILFRLKKLIYQTLMIPTVDKSKENAI